MSTAILFIAALHCEFLSKPICVENPQPQLGWAIGAPERGQSQSAYHVLVASTPELLAQDQGDLWDSGKVQSMQSAHVRYQGNTLKSGQRAYWKVRIWDQEGRPSDWSGPGYWEMGKLHAEDWTAKWIAMPPQLEGSPPSLDDLPHYNEAPSVESAKRMLEPAPQNGAPQFRREFALQKKAVRKARAYICGLGYYELYLNGQKAADADGPRVLDPGQTDYEQRALYAVYDLAPYLGDAKLAVGILLGNGFFNQRAVWGDLSYGKPRCIAQFEFEYEDGTRDVFVTDETWKAQRGPILMNNVYAGEYYDGRRETPGWDAPGFDDSAWVNAQVVESPTKRLEAQIMPPIREIGARAPVSFKETAPGVWTFDFGQNFSGWARVMARGPEGNITRMRYAEAAGLDGRIDTASTGTFATFVEQIDTYVCKGTGIPEKWEPRFTYHGFRYVEVTGLTRTPDQDTVTGVIVHTETPRNGTFECSDPMLNKIHETALWTMNSNLHSIPTDCPAREKCGWLGDAHVSAEMCLYNFYLPHFWRKYLDDIETTRRDNVPEMVAPGKRTGGTASPDWATAFIQIPWYLYLYEGDEAVLAKHYEGMRHLLEELRLQTEDGILKAGLGDWCPPGSVEPKLTPVPLTSTAYLYLDATIMANVANVLGIPRDADRCRSLARTTREAFLAKFYDPAKKTFESQTADAFALQLGLFPEEDEHALADSLARDIDKAHNGHHTTGITGSKFLYNQLTAHGHGATAMRVLHNTDYPSFGHLFSLGATTFWECWGEKELDEKWGPRSLNHHMQGGFDRWFYNGLAGINPDLARPGYQRTIFAPQIIDGLTYVKADVGSLYGNLHSEWRIADGRLTYTVALPPNTDARVRLPITDLSTLQESGMPLPELTEIHLTGHSPTEVELHVPSGQYEFSAPWPQPAAP